MSRVLRGRAHIGYAPIGLAMLALLHGLLYAWLVPPWQAPDEPAQFEYAALISTLGRVPTRDDTDPALERRITDSLVRQFFFEYLIGHRPQPLPRSLGDARAIFFMPRQVGSDPPLYFALAALPLRALAGHRIEVQLLALRLLGVLFTVGAVLCTYGAARALLPGERGFALAAGIFVALQPMFVFIGASAGNDGFANLLGAALCWATVRAIRQGLDRRRLAGLLALALPGALTKRTLLPLLLVLALVAIGLAIRSLTRVPLHRATRRGLGAVLLVLALGAWGVRGTLHRAIDPGAAADWELGAGAAPRVVAAPGTGQAALELRPGQMVAQTLPQVIAEWAQNQELRFRARVWTAKGIARGRLAIDFGWATAETPFEATGQAQIVEVRTFVPLFCPYVRVLVGADTGTLYADQLDAQSERKRGLNLLANGDLSRPFIRPGSVLAGLAGYLRLRELAWVWRSGRLLEPPPLGWELARIFFVSFWGQFGWMSVPLVGATPWEGALGLVCLGALLGLAGWLVRPHPPWQRRAVGLLLLILVAGLLFPLLNAYTQPRNQAIQQGRYLFPALAPIALLLVLGWRAFVPPRWRSVALAVWAAWWALFAAAAIELILRAYPA
jgi:hypothetical protein